MWIQTVELALKDGCGEHAHHSVHLAPTHPRTELNNRGLQVRYQLSEVAALKSALESALG